MKAASPLNPELAARLRAVVTRLGEREVCRRTGLTSGAIARGLSGLGVRIGTQYLIAELVRRLEETMGEANDGAGLRSARPGTAAEKAAPR